MRPKGLVNKRITKACPQCTLHVPTACKTCSCGFVFKRNVPPSPPIIMPDTPGRRRTGRVKKEPNYFNTMEYDQHFKRKRRSVSNSEEVGKRKKAKSKPVLIQVTKDDASDSKASSSCDTSQGKEDQEKVREEIQDAYVNITPEKGLQYAIILADINRKFLGQTFNPS